MADFDEFEDDCDDMEDDLSEDGDDCPEGLSGETGREEIEPEREIVGWREIAFLGAMSEAEAEERRRRKRE